MKKLFAFILTLALLLTLSACGEHSSPESVAEKFVTSYYTLDLEGILDSVPEFLLKKMEESYGAKSKKELIKEAEAVLDEDDIQECKVLLAKIDDDSGELEEYIDNCKEFGASIKDIAKIKEVLCQ